MSVCQALVSSQHDLDLFAPSWQAGLAGSQCLKKSLRNYDIESVNIVKTCEKLCLAFNEKSKANYNTSHDDGNQCSVKNSNVPFRAISNIWFGTLKIYQQQVNTLLHLSQDLFSRSCKYNIKHLEASKRKSSLTSHELVKKRRLTLSESNENPYITRNYSELLDELERLTQEPKRNSLVESFPVSTTQFQIREITIREINAATYTTPDLIDEDSGFGEATHEEIMEFFNFVGDNSMVKIKRTPTKRKLSCGQGSPVKKSCYINETSFEGLSQNIPLSENILKTSLKRSFTPTHISNAFDEHKNMQNTNILQTNFIDTNDLIETDKIKKENVSVVEDIQSSTLFETKKKKKHLIIDECTKIDMSEIIEGMKTSELLTKVYKRKVLQLNNSKRNKAALELLTRFNRRSFKLALLLKHKVYLSREQFKRDYLNLLREIFKIHYKEKWSSEIYPKWICFQDVQRKQNKMQSVNKSRKQNKFAVRPGVSINYLNEVCSTNEVDYNNFNEHQEILTTSNYNNMKTINTCILSEWRPYGVMVKVLNLWRFNQTNKIAAIKLFKLAENQINRALGFNSLLNLSKKQFVKLTNFPESIELQNILMGNAIKSSTTSDLN